MKTTPCLTLTLLTFVTLALTPNSFAQDVNPEYVVRVIYFLPNDRQPQPDMDTRLDTTIKEAQQFFADQMEAHGFGRKTFKFEADETGNVVVHHVNGKFDDAYYQHPSTQDMLWEEVEEQLDRSKSIYFVAPDKRMGIRLGILGTSASGIDINVIPGAELGLSYGKGPLVLDLNSRLFSGSQQDSKFASFSMEIGGRYHFLNKRNISPYLGGGLTRSYTHYEREERELREVCLRWSERPGLFSFIIPYTDTYCEEWGYEWRDILYTYKGTGLGAYGIIGIEFRHLHQSRFNLELRIDNPFYELDSPSNQRSISLGIPFSLGISLLHQF